MPEIPTIQVDLLGWQPLSMLLEIIRPVPTVKFIGATPLSLSPGMIGAAGTDHEPPTIRPLRQGDYQYGFRVPLIVVSAYTPAAYISNLRYDFGSILRFIEHNFGIPEGELTFADHRARTDLTDFFHMDQPPRPFQRVSATKDETYFLNDKTVPDRSGR